VLIAASLIVWLLTGNPRYLAFAKRAGQASLIAAAGLLFLLLAERLIVL
jgi:hypothetical protein